MPEITQKEIKFVEIMDKHDIFSECTADEKQHKLWLEVIRVSS